MTAIGDRLEGLTTNERAALEALARASAAAGMREEALKYFSLAEAAGEAIADEESKKIFAGDLNGGDWHGVR